MRELLDLEAPVALWAVVGAVLDGAGGEDLGVGAVAKRVEELSGGGYRRRASVGQVLARMRELHLAEVRRRRRGLQLPELIHTLTPRGLEVLAAARIDCARILSLS